MSTLSTIGEKIHPYAVQALDYVGCTNHIETALKADPIGVLTKFGVGLSTAYIGYKAFTTAWNSKSSAAKALLYTTAFSFFALTAYEIVAPLHGRVSVSDNWVPSYAANIGGTHDHIEL